jgi:hypothetical protein
MISMIIIMLLSTDYHEPVIIAAGFFGIITLILAIIALYKSQLLKLFYLGLFCLILGCINSFIYYTGTLISFLPIIQKITFFIFLLWICLINWKLYKQYHSVHFARVE